MAEHDPHSYGDSELWQCTICQKILSRKQRLLSHLMSVHGIEGECPQRHYKLYKKDPTVPIPRTTAFRRRLTNNGHSGTEESTSTFFGVTEDDNNSDGQYVPSNITVKDNNSSNSDTCASNVMMDYADDVANKQHAYHNQFIVNPGQNNSDNTDSSDIHYDFDSEITSRSDCDSRDFASSGEVSDSTDCSDFVHTDDQLSSDSESEGEHVQLQSKIKKKFSCQEKKSMALQSYIMRHQLSGQASRDLIMLQTLINPDYEAENLQKNLEDIGNCDFKIIDFCDTCNSLFPDEADAYQCRTPMCTGLRYKGALNKQSMKKHKSFFTCVPVENQIKDLLERGGMMKALNDYRSACDDKTSLVDVMTAEKYRQLRRPGNFLQSQNISPIFNTDGIPLYRSSKVGIWPVYLVINELPPILRFSRRNMILWGVWQGQCKPVFSTFLQPFVKNMHDLYSNGVSVIINGDTVKIRAILLAGTMDLQAKAYVACMTQHNGKYGCSTCEHPGEVVRQGRGHARVYKYSEEPYPLRTTEGVLEAAEEACRTQSPVKGIKGVSTLLALEWFDIVYGLVPDYMHGVLLGVVKKLNHCWFSASESKKEYFIGTHITQIDKRLIRMKPSDQISRVPLKLEGNLAHLKASELEMWLLFYCLPCLHGYMQDKYINHLALLVEGIYLLLQEDITVEMLNRAKEVLLHFYKAFSVLYGENNCTINLHNVGLHMAQYVEKMGPLWAWSCFAFEDMNGSILKGLHGTGNVCLQILCALHAQKRLGTDVTCMTDPGLYNFANRMLETGRTVKVKKETKNCKISGGMKKFQPSELIVTQAKQLLQIPMDVEIGYFSKVLRVILHKEVIYSSEYARMTKRTSHFVLVGDDTIKMACIKYFLYHHNTDSCLAVVHRVIAYPGNAPLLQPAVRHLIRVDASIESDLMQVIPVDKIREKLLFLGGNAKYHCVARLPNTSGQSA